MVRHNGRVIRGTIVAATRKGVPYDVAVIVCEPSTDGIEPCPISDRVAAVDQKVIAVGYGLGDYAGLTVHGCVIGTSFGLLTTTCSVPIGFSGGPVFTDDGRLLGLTVSKLSVNSVHFALPFPEIKETIQKYISTNDVKVLQDLESKCPLSKMHWNNGIPYINICHI